MAGVRSVAVGAIDLNLNLRLPAASFRRSLALSSNYTWNPWSAATARSKQQRSKRRSRGRLIIVSDFAGQYEEGFDDVHKVI